MKRRIKEYINNFYSVFNVLIIVECVNVLWRTWIMRDDK
jgi:hypothetical protein